MILVAKEAKRQIVHKLGAHDWTRCGLDTTWQEVLVRSQWRRVTCKNCLRSRPKR